MLFITYTPQNHKTWNCVPTIKFLVPPFDDAIVITFFPSLLACAKT